MEINWISIFTELTEQNKNIFTVGMKAYIANTDLYISPFERGRILCLAYFVCYVHSAPFHTLKFPVNE